MNQILVNAIDPQSSVRRHGRHELSELDSSRLGKHLQLKRLELAAVDGVVDAARPHFPGLTRNAVIRKIVEYNPDCVWTVTRRAIVGDATVVHGFIAMLPLTKEGLGLLAAEQFNSAEPNLSLICRRGERPAGIYMWAVYLPGRLAGGFSLFVDRIARPPYEGVNLYARPTTPVGVRFNEALGLHRNPKIGPVTARHLFEYRRALLDPLYDSHREPVDGELSIAVVRTMEDYARIICVRSAVYVGEQECPYEEEFDGNDMSSTHLVGYVGRDPAGCIRIRYFAGFAKIERLAIKKEYRRSRLAFQLVRAAIELCQMKGYHQLYGHAQKRLVNFWSRFGFRILEGGKGLIFSDFDYVEMVARIEPHHEAIRIGSDPYRIIRPEGRWHMPGILEMSASRQATRPSIGS